MPIEDMTISCVYRIWFPRGEKYYIGRCKNLKQRMASHQCDINRLAMFWETDRNEHHFYVHLMNHIIKTDSFTGYFSILEVCQNEEERVAGEQKWFDLCKEDPKCLNYGFVAKPWQPKLPPGDMETSES